MHHMNSEEISKFWAFERQRYADSQSPLVFKEVYHSFLEPKLVESREDWDNSSDDWFYIGADAQDDELEDWRVDRALMEEEKSELGKKAHESSEDCARACKEHEECFQWIWRDDYCGMKSSFLLGRPLKREDGEKSATSGWDLVKIKKWVKVQGDCEEVIWPEIED